MCVSRKGNKAKIADKIIPYFPKHISYIELFFGAGGMFFNKPTAKYNLRVIPIGQRLNIKNRRNEILCVNYDVPTLFN